MIIDLKYRTDIEMCDKYNLRASFTVETAAIFPVVFLVIVSAVYLSFFFHDKHILQSAVIETASIASERMRLFNASGDRRAGWTFAGADSWKNDLFFCSNGRNCM